MDEYKLPSRKEKNITDQESEWLWTSQYCTRGWNTMEQWLQNSEGKLECYKHFNYYSSSKVK